MAGETTDTNAGMVSAAASAGSSAIGSFLGFMGQERANKTNVKLAENARQHDIAMFNRQNEYNLPANQLKRMREAGLNPYLAYGSVPNNNTSATPQRAPVAQVENSLRGIDLTPIGNVINEYQDFKMKQASINNVNANINLTNQEIANKIVQQTLLTEQAKKVGIDTRTAQMLEKYQVQAFLSKLRGTELTNQNLYQSYIGKGLQNEGQKTKNQGYIIDNSLKTLNVKSKQLEYDFDKELRPYGLLSKDPYLYRALALGLNGSTADKVGNFVEKKVLDAITNTKDTYQKAKGYTKKKFTQVKAFTDVNFPLLRY